MRRRRRWLFPEWGFHLNRWRLAEYVEAMQNAGVVGIECEVLHQDEAGLMEILPRLSKRFRDVDPRRRPVIVVHTHARKPFQKDSDD